MFGLRARVRSRAAFVAVAAIASLCLIMRGISGGPAAADNDPAVVGQWSPELDIGIIGIHAAMLHTGKVMLFERQHDGPGSLAKLFDPATGTVTDATLPFVRDIFCGGLSFLPDGRLLVTGGNASQTTGGIGISEATQFDPSTNTWADAGTDEVPRWYPTNVELPDGRVLVFSGEADDGHPIATTDIYNGYLHTFTQQPASANMQLGTYARAELLPSGKVAVVGQQRRTWLYDPTTQSWSYVATANYGVRTYGSAVLLPGLEKILIAGGAQTGWATNTAETIDFSDPAPHWTYTGSMNEARHNLNLVLLPDQTVLAVGGNQYGARGLPVHDAELYDPATGQWSVMAAQQADRSYHSTALLLPDGRVLSAGADTGDPGQTTVEIYSPPYMFRGHRPWIQSATSWFYYGDKVGITTPDLASIAHVVLVRPGAVTHADDMDQRLVELPFALHGNHGLEATAPSSSSVAPPGYYMMFIVTADGIPSTGFWVHIGARP